MNALTYLDFELIKLLYKENDFSQRMISRKLNCSLGKANETLKKLKELDYLNEDNSLTNLGMNLIKKDKSAIILAAGQGIRMIPINNNVPKAMLEINGEILIERIIRQLLEANIHDITIVVGFMKEEFDYLIDQYHVKLVVNREYQEKNNLHSLNIVKDKINNTYIIPGDLYFYENPFLDNEIQSWYMLENRISKHSNVTCNTKNEIIKTKKDGLKMIGLSFINNQDASYLKEHLEHLDDGMHDSLFWEEALYQKNKMFIYGKIVDINYVDEINTYEELRNVDDHSVHLNNETLSLIADVFKINVEQIKNIKSLKKGMTNRSFLFEIDQDKYIMRIPGEGTDQLINRKEEYEVYQVIKDLNISDEVIYMNPQNGYKITKYLNDFGIISDDTQMTLFTANGLIWRETRGSLRGIAPLPTDAVYEAYLDWLDTQNNTNNHSIKISWIKNIKELNIARAPGNTCISALSSGKKGTIKEPINDSKGCGGIMRVAPIGLYMNNSENAGRFAAEVSAITHGHPLGNIPSYVFATMIYFTLNFSLYCCIAFCKDSSISRLSFNMK